MNASPFLPGHGAARATVVDGFTMRDGAELTETTGVLVVERMSAHGIGTGFGRHWRLREYHDRVSFS